MNGIEAVLLVLGFLSITISFFIGRKETARPDGDLEVDGVSRDVWTEKEEELIRGRIHSIMEEEKEDIVAETTDILNRKSNEKIMEFDEFSNQLMAKIDHNHDEVVFMYNMLTAKEEELKQTAVKLKAPASGQNGENSFAQSPKVQPLRGVEMLPQETEKSAEKELLTGLELLAGRDSVGTKGEGTAVRPQDADMKTKGTEYAELNEIQKAAGQTEGLSSAEHDEDVKDQILKMYKKGKSVVEISKELDVGQGEVKLTIALYGGKR